MFDVDTRIYQNFVFNHADKPQPNAVKFGFDSSPTYVGGGVFHVKATMIANGYSFQWAIETVTPK